MIIEILTSYFEPYKGGIETVVLNLAEGLGKKGHKVIIHTANSTPIHNNLKGYEEHEYYIVKRYPVYPYSLMFPKFLHRDSILSLHNYSCLMNDYVALRYPKRKKTLTPYGNISYERNQRAHKYLSLVYDSLLGQKTLESVDRIIAMTEFEKQGIINEYSKFKNKISVVPAGINFTYKNSNLKKPFSFPYFISIGRVTQAKRFDNVLKIMKHFPEYHYVLAGRNVEYAEELIALAKELDLNKRFHYIGEVTEKKKAELLTYGSVFITPDSANAFGIANLEAFYYLGKVVATRSGGIAELTAELGGEIFDVDDLYGLREAIENQLNEKLSFETQKRRRKLIEEKYSWDSVVDMYEKILLKLL